MKLREWFRGPTLGEVDAHIDVLDRAEPQQSQSIWRKDFDALSQALWRARRVRRYCGIPAAILAALIVIAFHGEAWDWHDIRNLFVAEGVVVLLTRFIMSKLFGVLEREERAATLLRYYGARDLPVEEGVLP